MQAAVATLFPELFSPFMECGIVGRAVEQGLVDIRILDIRDRAVDDRGSVDDYQFGGGAGMLLRPEPLFETLERIPWMDDARVIFMTPQGKRLNHDLARELAESGRMIIFCGRYGGIDQRFRDTAVTDEISVADAVVSGGEIPAMFLLEAVFRWLPGVLGRMESAQSDSFATGLLDYPRYTRPADYRGIKVPEVIISGNHAEIEDWRFRKALELTMRKRPDLIDSESEEIIKERFIRSLRLADRQKEQKNG
ncbi:MAG: tRNA (guanosine(37)-N1)-methyltransferase TrmD [Candidatus Aegiribacteria sp.]|nr:tRNA (guanosine(37)-N1)-methyltransferase TrmD [Candidatus Aegiribacteria sp.]